MPPAPTFSFAIFCRNECDKDCPLIRAQTRPLPAHGSQRGGKVSTTTETTGTSERQVAHIYNAAVAASAISAAWDIGLLDELRDQGTVDAEEYADRRDLDADSTVGLLRALASVDIVRRDGARAEPAALFDEVYRTRSFFHWLMRGSGGLFREAPEAMRNENRSGSFYQRDSAAIARACREISKFCYDPWFHRAVNGLDFPLTTVADLGCGSGERIMQVLRQFPEARGIGIDVAEPALADATEDAARAGLSDRLLFLHADVLEMAAHPSFAEVQLVTCFMMGHDFWPRENCIRQLRRIRALFPAVRRLILGDATRSVGTPDRELRTFTLGFELAHDLMGTFIPTVTDWESVFEEGGWTLRWKHMIDIAVGEVVFELDPA
ncbi:class I SAM-dependent methyltransferase [Streptomyces orinoci]|uniref:Class I SAM-dependent methyltransferase n=1 Tax=Streptomyces orinoci TaxID=67339 RepID=A0ABV3K2T5_STRON